MRKLFIYKENIDENTKRRISILSTLCLSITVFLIILLSIIIYSLSTQPTRDTRVPITIILTLTVVSVISFIITKQGKLLLGSLITLFLLYGCILYGSINWGADLPTILITSFIVILISGILINSKAGLFSAVLLSLHLFLFHHLSFYHIITPNYNWKTDAFNIFDTLEYSSLLIFAALFSWLSNSQLEKTLIKYQESEAKLQFEKDNLEIKVKERTDEINRLQIDKINSMYRLVEFGRISSGLFHDIMTPLTNIALNLQIHKVEEVKESMSKLIPSIKKIENLINQSRKHIKINDLSTTWNIEQEIHSAIELLKSKAIKSEVKLIFSNKNKSKELYGPQVLFSHIIMNLLSNGIDAHADRQTNSDTTQFRAQFPAPSSSETPSISKIVLIKTKIKNEKINIKVIDNGSGIKEEIIKNIFEPFYTTKEEHGCGIGLSSTKHIIEKYFKGTISVRSRLGRGTTFEVEIPMF